MLDNQAAYDFYADPANRVPVGPCRRRVKAVVHCEYCGARLVHDLCPTCDPVTA